jgi:hypothetical protein
MHRRWRAQSRGRGMFTRLGAAIAQVTRPAAAAVKEAQLLLSLLVLLLLLLSARCRLRLLLLILHALLLFRLHHRHTHSQSRNCVQRCIVNRRYIAHVTNFRYTTLLYHRARHLGLCLPQSHLVVDQRVQCQHRPDLRRLRRKIGCVSTANATHHAGHVHHEHHVVGLRARRYARQHKTPSKSGRRVAPEG